MVPGDGFEPPTRGFSILLSLCLGESVGHGYHISFHILFPYFTPKSSEKVLQKIDHLKTCFLGVDY